MSSSVLSPAAADELSPRRKPLVLAICCISMIVVVMDISIVNVALPAMGRGHRGPRAGEHRALGFPHRRACSRPVRAGGCAGGGK
jgi:hypothetical protein